MGIFTEQGTKDLVIIKFIKGQYITAYLLCCREKKLIEIEVTSEIIYP